jgi:hypothetical protein
MQDARRFKMVKISALGGMLIVIGTLGGGTHVANAQAKPTPKPTAATGCVPSGSMTFDQKTKSLIVCDYDNTKCVAVNPATQALSKSSAATAVVADHHLNAANNAICVGSGDNDCVALGKKAKAAVAKLVSIPDPQDTNVPLSVELSADRKFAIVAQTAWDLKKDKAVKVRAWASGDNTMGPADATGFAGELLIYSIVPCAGPCSESRLYSRSGKALGKSFEGIWGGMIQQSEDNLFTVGEYGSVIRIAPKKKKVSTWNELKSDERNPVAGAAAFLIGTEPYVAVQADSSFGAAALRITKLTADASAKASSFTVPVCND